MFNGSLSGQVSLNVLTIDLSGLVRLKSQSIEHELFHLYQNGYTFFKNRWYTEGTARWSELVMSGHIGRGEELPKTTIQKEELFNKSYGANKFWNELIAKVDQKTLGKKFVRYYLSNWIMLMTLQLGIMVWIIKTERNQNKEAIKTTFIYEMQP
ncbi:MAG: hypothetical protein ACI9T7_002842 [Oleiphilaceae bacterium]|jgi:hypothetical protein